MPFHIIRHITAESSWDLEGRIVEALCLSPFPRHRGTDCLESCTQVPSPPIYESIADEVSFLNALDENDFVVAWEPLGDPPCPSEDDDDDDGARIQLADRTG